MLPWLKPLNTVSPMYRPAGFFRSYDHLIERAGDELSAYYGSLAESIALSHDRRRIVFRLRRRLAGMTAGQLPRLMSNFLSRRFVAPTSWARVGRAISWVTDVNILDPLTVEIRAESDVAKQLFVLGYLPILPAHYWLERDVSEPTMAPPPQSGPYRLTGVSQDRYLIYERVPDYWGRNLR